MTTVGKIFEAWKILIEILKMRPNIHPVEWITDDRFSVSIV